MKKSFKRIVASVMAVATLVMSSTIMSVNAADADVAGITGTPFDFSMGRGGKDTDQAIKKNDLGYAMIDIHQSNLSNTATMNFCMKNYSGTTISPSKTRTNNIYFELFH